MTTQTFNINSKAITEIAVLNNCDRLTACARLHADKLGITDIEMPHQIKIEFLMPHQIQNDILVQIISKQLNNYFGMSLV